VLMMAATVRSNTLSYPSGTYTGTTGTTSLSGGTAGDGGPAVTFNGDIVNASGASFSGGPGGDSGGTAPINTGGNGGPGVLATNLSTLTITGGQFVGGTGGFAALGSTNNITGNGGSALALQSGSTASVYGGVFVPGDPGLVINNDVPGVPGYDFDLSGGSTLTLYGTFTGAPSNPITGGSGSFTGTLADNGFSQTFTYNVPRGDNEIIFAPAPEPTSIGLLIAGTATMFLRRQRRH
jgi:hypothetical protein